MHKNDQTENKRHPAHLQEVRLHDRRHPDVVIQVVDLDQVLAIQTTADDFVAVDEQIESVRILRGDQMHSPKLEKKRRDDRRRRQEQEETRPEIERPREETEFAAE